MGMIRIETSGSFKQESFATCAEEGGHVQALSRAIIYLSGRLSEAVKKDVQLTVEGIKPPKAPLGESLPRVDQGR